MEIRDDSKTTFDEAIALSTYSNRHAGVLSYVAIFENLWRQAELYEGLKLHAKAQKEFINVTAHELRTLVQPILGLSQLLPSKTGSIEQYRSLSEDILDATKIESIFVFGNPSLFLLICTARMHIIIGSIRRTITYAGRGYYYQSKYRHDSDYCKA